MIKLSHIITTLPTQILLGNYIGKRIVREEASISGEERCIKTKLMLHTQMECMI